ncbi:hypothetical protein [Microbacterium sp.]|uniref:hypothetical protein n=1 Tax=Microbacterium sp. TaxID=51671 RepID=UPI002811FD69|nr:hypothetical protein [Microbacterium sp.]
MANTSGESDQARGGAEVVPPAPVSPYIPPTTVPLAPPVPASPAPAVTRVIPHPGPPHLTAPPSQASPPAPGWVPAAVIATIVVVVVTAIIAATALLTSQPDAPALPTPAATASPDEGADPGNGAVDASSIEGHLEAKIEQYKRARDDGSLWTQIPRSDFNLTAVTAFLFFLTDMKLAASFGVDDATAGEYLAESAELERLLLAQEPLGSDIEITFSEDRVFRYDGDTGEGGYSTE